MAETATTTSVRRRRRVRPAPERHVISLFDHTGNMVRPWLSEGYTCWIVDQQHEGHTQEGRLHRVYADLTRPWMPPVDRSRIAFICAFPPCDHLAISGARWFRGKGLRALEHSVSLFATAAETCEWAGAPYMIENPVSTMSTYWREPDHIFDPFHFAGYSRSDNYTKRTCLWTGGGFVMPEQYLDNELDAPDNRVFMAGQSKARKMKRSTTPLGFAMAVHKANRPAT